MNMYRQSQKYGAKLYYLAEGHQLHVPALDAFSVVSLISIGANTKIVIIHSINLNV